MSQTEMLRELPKLTPEERQEVRVRLAELDRDDWLDEGVLADAEKAIKPRPAFQENPSLRIGDESWSNESRTKVERKLLTLALWL
jgi:hypothetical protein